jgi:hypothetical protein
MLNEVRLLYELYGFIYMTWQLIYKTTLEFHTLTMLPLLLIKIEATDFDIQEILYFDNQAIVLSSNIVLIP